MRKATSVVRRRRIALALTAVIGMAAAAVVFFTSARTYEATAGVLLLPPASTVEEDGNPLLQLGGLQQVVDVVAAEVSDTINEPEFAAGYPNAEIEVAPDGRTSAPTLSVIVHDVDPAAALAIRDEVAAMALNQLQQIQTAIAIDPTRQVTAIILTESTTAEEQLTARIRSAIVAGAGVGLALLLLAGLLESILVRRQSDPPTDPDADANRTAAEPPADDEPGTLGSDASASGSEADSGPRPPATGPEQESVHDPKADSPATTTDEDSSRSDPDPLPHRDLAESATFRR